MQLLIQFMGNVDLLSDDEFFNSLRYIGKQKMIKIFFNHYNESIKLPQNVNSNNYNQELQMINDKISDIIALREESIGIDQNESITLNELPSTMINYISQFLELDNILHLEKCTRSIFIGVRSKPLNYMTEDNFGKYLNFAINNNHIYNLERFKWLNELSIDVYNKYISVDDMPCFKLKNLCIWQQLRSLYLQVCPDSEPYKKNLGDYMLNNIAQCNLPNLKSFRFGGHIERIMELNIFSKMPKLQHFALCLEPEYGGLSKETEDKLSIELQSLSHLNALSFTIGVPTTIDLILKKISHNLQSLHLDMIERGDTHTCLQESNFVNLQEIWMDEPCKRDIDILVDQNLKNLRRICIDTQGYNYNDEFITNEFQQSLQLLLSLKSLTEIYLNLWDDFSDVCEIMMNILIKALQANKYNTLKIKIGSMHYGDDVGDSLIKLAEILKSQCKHFMLICDIKTSADRNTKTNDAIRKLLNNKSDKTVMEYQSYLTPFNAQMLQQKFVFKNKQCITKENDDTWIVHPAMYI